MAGSNYIPHICVSGFFPDTRLCFDIFWGSWEKERENYPFQQPSGFSALKQCCSRRILCPWEETALRKVGGGNLLHNHPRLPSRCHLGLTPCPWSPHWTGWWWLGAKGRQESIIPSHFQNTLCYFYRAMHKDTILADNPGGIYREKKNLPSPNSFFKSRWQLRRLFGIGISQVRENPARKQSLWNVSNAKHQLV